MTIRMEQTPRFLFMGVWKHCARGKAFCPLLSGRRPAPGGRRAEEKNACCTKGPRGYIITNSVFAVSGRQETGFARKKVNTMKAGIHPEFKVTKVTCACGETFETGSVKENLRVEICSKCHPFFTGKQKFVDTGGRVDRFKKKYNL